MIEGIFFLIFGLAALYFTLWIFILLPARMAEARGRSAFRWVLISIFFSPACSCGCSATVLIVGLIRPATDRFQSLSRRMQPKDIGVMPAGWWWNSATRR